MSLTIFSLARDETFLEEFFLFAGRIISFAQVRVDLTKREEIQTYIKLS